MASMSFSMWEFVNRMLRSEALKLAISGREIVGKGEEGGRDWLGGEREEMRSGGAQCGAIWAARSMPEAELPIMRTFWKKLVVGMCEFNGG
jgi:hypothetical protein